MRGLRGCWAAGNGELGMKLLLITVVASLTLFVAGITTVYLTPPPERTGSKFVLRINADGPTPEAAATPEAEVAASPIENDQAPTEEAPPSSAGEYDVPPIASNDAPQAEDDAKAAEEEAQRDALEDLQRRFEERARAAQNQEPEPADTNIASSRAMENDAPDSADPEPVTPDRADTEPVDPRFAFPRQSVDEPSPDTSAPDRLAVSPLEAPAQPSPPQDAPQADNQLPDSRTTASTEDAAPAPGSPDDAALAKAFDATARQLENSWRATVRQTTPTIPVPPVPRKRAQSQPPIPRGTQSAAPPAPTDVKTAGTEQRNAAIGLFTGSTTPTGSALATPGGNQGAPRIAIIVRDLGLDERETYSAINSLRPEITLAFSPYGRDVKGWAMRARQSGHEVFAGVPMEPVSISVTDAAPNMLLASLPADENNRRLQWALDQIDGYKGVINIMGGKLAQSPDAIRPFMQALRERGLTYVDDGAAAHPYAIMLAAQLDVRYRVADGKVGARPSPTFIERELAKLEAIAREKGSALAVANADAETLRQLVIWTTTLESKSITLVHASQIVNAVNLQ